MTKIFIIVYLYLFIQMSFVWIMYRLLKNPSIVDVSWSIGLMIAGLIYLFSHTMTLRTALASSLLIIWGLRLAGYLWWNRIRKGHVDKRYIELSDQWKINKSLGFFLNFQLQGLFIFIISINFYFTSYTNQSMLSVLDIIACIIVILSILGETIADRQLQRFKTTSSGQVCNVGLWRYSRHPNYFFDWLTWCGFTLFSLSHEYGYISIISPLFLYIIFTQITGPITEKGSIQSRGQAYLTYQKETSMFFPWFKHKLISE